jgi:hypothetical protein
VASTPSRGGTLESKLCARSARRGARSRIRIRSCASWLSATVASPHGSVSPAEVAFAARNKRFECVRTRFSRPVATDSGRSHVVSTWAHCARVRGSQISQHFLPKSVIFYADSEPGNGLAERGGAGAYLVFCGFGVATLVGRASWLTGPPVATSKESGWAERSSSARG